MGLKLIHAVANDTEVKGQAYQVFRSLALFADDDTGLSWPTTADVARHSRTAPTHVRAAIRTLETMGRVKRLGRLPGQYGPMKYQLKPHHSDQTDSSALTDSSGLKTDPPLTNSSPQPDRSGVTDSSLRGDESVCQGGRIRLSGVTNPSPNNQYNQYNQNKPDPQPTLPGLECVENHTEQESEKQRRGELVDRFKRFWEAYPRKVAKADALKVWMKLKPTEQILEQMLDALGWQTKSEQWTKDGGQYVPHPTTWLRKRRWEDEQPRGKAAARPAAPSGSSSAALATSPGPSEQAIENASHWVTVLERIEQDIDPEAFDAYFHECAHCEAISEQGVWLIAPTEFSARWMRSNYSEFIGEIVARVFGYAEAPEVFVRVDDGPDDDSSRED